jgi:hypothetical protein
LALLSITAPFDSYELLSYSVRLEPVNLGKTYHHPEAELAQLLLAFSRDPYRTFFAKDEEGESCVRPQ